jgi:hypothetical protein
MRAMVILLTLLVVGFSPWSFAQECTTYALVGAYDRKSGDAVENLKADDFEARMKGKEIPVLSATQQFNSRVLILVETDGRRSDRVDEAVNLATRLARQTPGGKALAFGAFAKRSRFTQGFIDDESNRSAAISSVIEEADTLGKGVALYNALHNALSLFGPHQPGDTVVLISDGYDDSSNRSGTEVEQEYLSRGTRLVMMYRQQPSDVTGNFLFNSPEHDRERLEHMSARSGGTYTMFDAYSFNMASHGYLVAVRIPEGDRKPRQWKLRLRRSSTVTKRVQLYYPDRLLPCSAPAASVSAKKESAP